MGSCVLLMWFADCIWSMLWVQTHALQHAASLNKTSVTSMSTKHDTSCLDPIIKTYITHVLIQHTLQSAANIKANTALCTRCVASLLTRGAYRHCRCAWINAWHAAATLFHKSRRTCTSATRLLERAIILYSGHVMFVCKHVLRTALMPVRCSHQWPYFFRDAKGVLLISDQFRAYMHVQVLLLLSCV